MVSTTQASFWYCHISAGGSRRRIFGGPSNAAMSARANPSKAAGSKLATNAGARLGRAGTGAILGRQLLVTTGRGAGPAELVDEVPTTAGGKGSTGAAQAATTAANASAGSRNVYG